MSTDIELTEYGRFLFETQHDSRICGIVEELSDTSVLIKWEASGNSVWYPLHKFKSIGFATPEYRIVEKLKPSSKP